MAEKEFKLPDVGEGVAEGELVNWLVATGDTVTEDQPVAEVETDKALVEVPSPYNGTVKQLHVEEGQMVPVGDVIVTYDVPEEGDDASGESGEPAGDEPEATDPDGSADADADAASGEPATTDSDAGSADEAPEPSSGRVFAPPSARRLARELGVDIAAVEGSGPGGRVSEGDVRAHAESGESGDAGAAGGDSSGPKQVDMGSKQSAVSRKGGDDADGATAEAAAGSAPSSVEAAGRDRTLAVPATRKAAEDAGVDLDDVPTDETRDGEAFVTSEQVQGYAQAVKEAKAAEAEGAAAGGDETGAPDRSAAAGNGAAASREPESVPYRGVRRTIGEQMETSKYTAPHVSHHDTAVVDDLVDVRADLKERAAERDVRLSYMPFVMKALVAGLKEFPYLNSELREDNEEILLKKEYNLGIAVATDAGLMVPVVKHVDEKSILELAAEVNDLASRARERKVSREEMQGGTFTITNFGAIGGEYATPIINYPETAIMGLGAIDERPVAEDGTVRAAHTLPLSLSIDHRVIDGAEAGQFTNYVMERLENPSLLLLE
ncbi:dihydrolipoamide acetyltransferase family protein [Halobaculum rubrum]|uniref:dihydrolipoamide acetyltransferase family protein n=1 Tax=Halobaculum rubrum TaxID=2872158 RepID=UPI001CA3ADB6|nr:dihydrolipoamide acetyltransferase family protein [Halobaculum rubrum]QZY00892.1 2-oxo acid dehydrogenase subunit E2 [Halobaculum rubrum]